MTIKSMVALVVNIFEEEQEETPLAVGIESVLKELSETFDKPLADGDIARTKTPGF